MEELRLMTMKFILGRVVPFHPYDFGWGQNLTSLLGQNKLLWLIPTIQDNDPFKWKVSTQYREKVLLKLDRF